MTNGDLTTGVVTGDVTVDHRHARGSRVPLRAAAVVAFAGLPAAAYAGGLSLLFWGFAVALGVLLVLLGIDRFVLGGPRRAHRCEVRRFRLTDEQRRPVDCVATGRLAGVWLRPGDHIEVRGRRTRHGIVVRRILVTVTGVGATPRPGVDFLLARAVHLLTVVLVAAVVMLVVLLSLAIG